MLQARPKAGPPTIDKIPNAVSLQRIIITDSEFDYINNNFLDTITSSNDNIPKDHEDGKGGTII
jgi:hypothetical protein